MRPILILRHVRDEPPGTTVDFLRSAGVETELWDLTCDQPRQFNPRQWAGLVMLGGPMNVEQTSEFPFLTQELQWVRAALKDKLPILGLCLGGQLLAKALGSRVTQNPVPEVGWHRIELTSAGEQDPLLSDTPSPIQVCQWHGDTFELPAGGVLLATSAACRHQAFRFGTTAWGLQFHPEVNAELLATWIADHGDPNDRCCPGKNGVEQIRQTSNEYLPQVQILGRRILGRFAKLCKELADSRCIV